MLLCAASGTDGHRHRSSVQRHRSPVQRHRRQTNFELKSFRRVEKRLHAGLYKGCLCWFMLHHRFQLHSRHPAYILYYLHNMATMKAATLSFKVLVVALLLLAYVGLVTHAQPSCGSQGGGGTCSNNQCCSQYGYCGLGGDYCGTGCQSGPCY